MTAALWLSLRIAGMATLLAGLVGIGLAFIVSRRRFWGKSALEAVLTMPLVLPPTVVGYLIILALGRQSWIGRAFHYSIVFRIEGAILAAAVVALPMVYLPSRAAFSAIDREMEDLAKLFGANALQSFWHVSLPMARQGICSGLVLGFARALGEFGATMMVFGSREGRSTLSISIYQDFDSGDLAHALPAVLILIAISVGVMLLYSRVLVRQ